jgi:heme-degrading monooxygenase HmoA
MHIALVTYSPDRALTEADIQARFEASQPIFSGMPGLVRKYFCFDAEQWEGSSVYTWESKEAAQACFNSPQFLEGFRGAFGCEPTIKHLDVKYVIDNS